MIDLSSEIPAQARVWRNHPDIRRWCRQHTLISISHHERWLKRIEEDPSIKMFGIVAVQTANSHPEYDDGIGSVHTQIPVGVCGLTSIDRLNQKAEFSLYIAPGQHSKGYGEAALRRLCDHGFKDMNLNRIWGEVFDGNPAMKTFERVGFKLEGIQRQSYFRDGKFIDSLIISRLRTE